MRSLYTFLENRWYINAIYYKVFVNAPIAIGGWMLANVEIGFLDRSSDAGASLATLAIYLSKAGNWFDVNVVDAIADGISGAGQAISRMARRMQTGVLKDYILVFALGIAILLVLLILATGSGWPL